MKIILSFLLVSLISAQSLDELEAIKKQLNKSLFKLDNKITNNDSLQSMEEDRFNTILTRYKNSFIKKDEELKGLAKNLKDLQRSISIQKSKQGAYAAKMENVAYQRKQWVQKLITLGKEFETKIGKTLPWNKEARLDRIRVLIKDLEAENANVEEGFVRLKSLYEDELKFSDEVILETKAVTRNDGKIVNANVLRIGALWAAYVDDQEKHYGVLNYENGEYIWSEDLSFPERESVRRAIAVKGAKKAPQIVLLPLKINMENK
jgi:hypothetical protein